MVSRAGRALDVEKLRAAGDGLAHRGPDDRGYLGWNGHEAPRRGRQSDVCRGATVMLVHRRLAILDLTDAGWQPMSSPDGRFHIVFNGEIYNYRELRVELEGAGCQFVSHSDTEVLLAAWGEWGVGALNRLVGMFAFAVLDTRESRLFLARDFFGIKPLYYTVSPDGFAFASEIKTLLTLAIPKPRANPQRLYHYLRFGITDHGGETLFADVRQVPPAHHLELDLDRPAEPRPVRYWELDLDGRCELSFDEAAQRLRELFLDSVRLHLRSDVPVGAALSGGIDSSAIVMAMRHLQGAQLDLHTISYIADDPEISEHAWVQLVGRQARAVIHETRPGPGDLLADLERLIAVQDEPFGSTSIYAQYRVFGAARAAGIKVMLDGQGADELLGGYRTYLASRVASLLRQGQVGRAASLLRAARALPGARTRDLLTGLGYVMLPAVLHDAARRLAGRDLLPGWIGRSWFERQGVDLGSPLPRPRGRDALREALHFTLTTSSLPPLLRYEDRNSMAFSIESRVPFLTPAIAAFVLSLPESYIIGPDGTSKAVFRRAMRGIVPDAVLDRRDKIGFATPEREWLMRLRGWVEGTLASEQAREIPALDLTGARREWEGIVAGRRRFDWHVWRWVNTIRWAEGLGVEFAR